MPALPAPALEAPRRLRLAGVRILTMRADGEVLDGMDLWIEDGRVLALTPKGAAPPSDAAFETLSFRNALVMPGMVNSHSHSSSSIARGSIAGEPLDLFVLAAMARRAL